MPEELKTPSDHHYVLLSNDEIKEVIAALEHKAGDVETELGNDLKMVLAGTL